MSKALYTNPAAPGIYAKNPFTVDGNVVTMQISQGQVTLFDLVDFSLVAAFRWYTKPTSQTFYALTDLPKFGGKRRRLRMHLLFQETNSSQPVVDHKNHNGLDNRRGNLRACTQAENLLNRRASAGKASQYKGVARCRTNRWRAYIQVLGKTKHIGVFDDETAAARAYDKAARRLHREFACLNFPAAPG